MNEIDAIIYFDDLADLERFNPENITVSDHSETVDRLKYTHFNHKQWTSLDISADEIRHVLRFINDCQDFYRYPSTKFRTFPEFIRRYGLTINQTNIESVLQCLQTEVFCKESCSTDNDFWKRTFLKYEFYNSKLKFSNGRSISKYGLPLVIYIVIAENLRENKAFALVSFSSYDFERCFLKWNSPRRVNLNYVEKIGSAYILSVVAKPCSAEDPFLKFYISEDRYNGIIHLIEGLSEQDHIKCLLQLKRDAYKTHVVYKSLDPINHGLPIPVDYF